MFCKAALLFLTSIFSSHRSSLYLIKDWGNLSVEIEYLYFLIHAAQHPSIWFNRTLYIVFWEILHIKINTQANLFSLLFRTFDSLMFYSLIIATFFVSLSYYWSIFLPLFSLLCPTFETYGEYFFTSDSAIPTPNFYFNFMFEDDLLGVNCDWDGMYWLSYMTYILFFPIGTPPIFKTLEITASRL